ncbi:hypothetical protein PV11_03768 [Exophiala sideris]|uniref:Uncharacterized protein n=1 Tax=Exophiala sideris TaxID=1016849 RepID=A0A0D1VYW4_9EURO|nr:hypothetical protein PV11_03768 [Exophiala sideris]
MSRRDLHLRHSTAEMTSTEPIPDTHKDDNDEIEWETITTASSETERGDIDTTIPNGAILPPSPPHDFDLTLPPSHQEPEPRKRLSYKDALCSSLPAQDDDALPAILIEEYNPDSTLMSGAVDPRDANVPATLGLSSSDDDIMCSTRNLFQHCYERMPYRVLYRSNLYELGLPFEDIRRLRGLGCDFVTTFRGVERAWDEFEGIQRDYYQRTIHGDENLDIDLDEALLVALAKRGGTSRRQVVYPEFIYPFWPKPWDDSDDSSEAETDREDMTKANAGGDASASEEESSKPRKRAKLELDFGFDDEYWDELIAQGNIWDEIQVPRL